MTKKYVYFVSFTYMCEHHKLSSGNGDVISNFLVSGYEHVQQMQDALSKTKSINNLVITNFILLREEDSE